MKLTEQMISNNLIRNIRAVEEDPLESDITLEKPTTDEGWDDYCSKTEDYKLKDKESWQKDCVIKVNNIDQNDLHTTLQNAEIGGNTTQEILIIVLVVVVLIILIAFLVKKFRTNKNNNYEQQQGY